MEFVVFIHWDDNHVSPAIGPFKTHTMTKAFMRDFRKSWKAKNDRRPVTGKPCPRLSATRIVTPEEGAAWG